MRIYMGLIQTLIAVVALLISTQSSASTIYLAEIDPFQSSGVIWDENETPYQISGTLKIIIDNNTIQFANVNSLTTPLDVSNELIIPAIGSYSYFGGPNFLYNQCHPSLPVICNSYSGTFDGDSLFMEATTVTDTFYDFTIYSSNISVVPLPSALLLFLSGIFGLFFSSRIKASNKIINLTTKSYGL